MFIMIIIMDASDIIVIAVLKCGNVALSISISLLSLASLQLLTLFRVLNEFNSSQLHMMVAIRLKKKVCMMACL